MARYLLLKNKLFQNKDVLIQVYSFSTPSAFHCVSETFCWDSYQTILLYHLCRQNHQITQQKNKNKGEF